MFDSIKEDLKDILRKVDEGRLQLPDFQRDYVWGEEDVRSLIASIAKGFPVGALLTLESGGSVNFKPRLLEGVPEKSTKPDELLLDGQQRITSLYQSTFSKNPIKTKTVKKVLVERYYYIDIKHAVETGADILEAIVSVPPDRVVRSNFAKNVVLDLSTPEKEYEHDMFPLNQSFDNKDWFFGWRMHWKTQGRELLDLERDFDRNVLENINRYKMPIIRLDRKNSREAICLVFEKVNVGGKKLDAFELLTSIFASDDFDLREAWNGTSSKDHPGIKSRMIGTDHPRTVLKKIESTDFLQACTLLHTRELRLKKAVTGATGKDLPQISCKRDALLALPLEAFRAYAPEIEHGFVEAAAFLHEQKIISPNDVPYYPQIIALSSVYAILGKKAKTVPAKEKITRWFWSITLGELYGSSSESLMARDVPALADWISNQGEEPKTIEQAIVQISRLRSLRSRNSAAYKGLHALMMKIGCLDFIHGDSVEVMTFFKRKIDIHHIFPRKWCLQQGISPRVFNSIVNKTPLSKESNITIGGKAPSEYLKRIEAKTNLSPKKLDDILRSHLIEPKFLRNDDFDGFFEARIQALSATIGSVMGKPVVQDHIEEEGPEIDDDEIVEGEADDAEDTEDGE